MCYMLQIALDIERSHIAWDIANMAPLDDITNGKLQKKPKWIYRGFYAFSCETGMPIYIIKQHITFCNEM